jgi:hypothetical protein
MIEDHAAFFTDFAEPVTLAGVVLASGGIFDRQYRTASVESFGIEDAGPAVLCIDAELGAADHHDDTAIIRGASYLVIGVEPDGVGFTLLRLRKI